MSGKKSRDKGARGELELAGKLREYGYNTSRGAQHCGKGGAHDVVGLPGINPEVKRVEALRLWDALAQAKRDCKTDELPAVFHRKNHEEWVVIMPLDNWMQLYMKWEECRDE